MERSRLELVAGNAADELRAAGWIPKTAEVFDNDVVLLSASKDTISILFQANVRSDGQPLVQPSVAMHRDPAMRHSGCVDFVWADVPVSDSGTMTNDGLARFRNAISQSDGIIENRQNAN